jgi:low affinity Fe/Cu permease
MTIILVITALIIVALVVLWSDKNQILKNVFLTVLLFIVVFIRANTRQKKEMENINEFNGPLISNEGDNRSYNDIVSLIDLINEHNSIYPLLKIKVTGIESKEKLNFDKKYCVKIKTLNGGYISEINIREQDNN